MCKEIKPYDNTSSKKKQIEIMFDNISHRYDFLNHFLSAGIDRRWRDKVVDIVKTHNPKNILDIATGTGDLAISLSSTSAQEIIGLDISKGMLKIARDKVSKKKLEKKISFIQGDSEQLPFGDNTFDVITVAFGVRNFENIQKGMQEIYRVLKPKGLLVVLELSQPSRFPVRQIYNFYFKYILPFIGKIVSKDNSAYQYLPESVEAFSHGNKYVNILSECLFQNIKIKPLSLGIASIYTAVR
ncbi:bifunctional demethylmenaquinone methyltransferase/2-methoxy-6-polyprenyl-1,4-benzoquinol methylase UbiE [Ichthyobacterium seriolicida]|uniref:Demethylmenaquinone methyltransferase n=1 Tax=Ichthyobacterium seriolicida TaxID=242600 RepID=A0A1J1E694_9FLAO|nr:bifunctional demethylmenaquinone methyltransferase/2-methoxy-6-polyprenyl-1,4-benzoquinol methylase UbiE [Ichthyobacterium seriolicida]BAV94846.1 ubiquinone/menaquinone biosynthesis methyltransferase [Ichthyobacterium seriolicida]